MIRTTIIPNTKIFPLNIPEGYIGKKIEVLFYADDEGREEIPAATTIATLRGKLNLTNQQREHFHQHLKDIRNEWNKDI